MINEAWAITLSAVPPWALWMVWTQSGLSANPFPAGCNDGHTTAKVMGWKEAHDIIMKWPSSRAMLQDGPSIYGYAKQSPAVQLDPLGLSTAAGNSSQRVIGSQVCLDAETCTDNYDFEGICSFGRGSGAARVIRSA